MNIHEYQGKEILKSFGVAVQEGIVADTVEQAVEAAKKMKTDFNSDWVVIKAQIHAGGRGKGKIKENGINGVKVGKGLDEVVDFAQKILIQIFVRQYLHYKAQSKKSAVLPIC